jgi:non-homologous end joining protein Ku
MTARAIGSGSLAFGEVHIPVKLFASTARGRRRPRPATTVTDEAQGERGGDAIEIIQLAAADRVATEPDEHALFLGPDHGGARAYAALERTLATSGRVAIARHLADGEARLVAVKAEGGVLVLRPLRAVGERRLPRAHGEAHERAA